MAATARVIFPNELRRLADLCDGLNKLDGAGSPDCVKFAAGLTVTDRDGDTRGQLRDNVGGAWCFTAEVYDA